MKNIKEAVEKDIIELEWNTPGGYKAKIVNRVLDTKEEIRCGYLIIDDPLDPILKITHNAFIFDKLTEIAESKIKFASVVKEDNICTIGFNTKGVENDEFKTLDWMIKECNIISLNLNYNYEKHSSPIFFSLNQSLIRYNKSSTYNFANNNILSTISFAFDRNDVKKPYDIIDNIAREVNKFQYNCRLSNRLTYSAAKFEVNTKFTIRVFFKDDTFIDLVNSKFGTDDINGYTEDKKHMIDMGLIAIPRIEVTDKDIRIVMESTVMDGTKYPNNIIDSEILAIFIIHSDFISEGELASNDVCLKLYLDKKNCNINDMYNFNSFLDKI